MSDSPSYHRRVYSQPQLHSIPLAYSEDRLDFVGGHGKLFRYTDDTLKQLSDFLRPSNQLYHPPQEQLPRFR